MTQPTPISTQEIPDQGVTWDVVEEAIATINRAFEEDAIQREDHLQDMQDAVDDWRKELDVIKRSKDIG